MRDPKRQMLIGLIMLVIGAVLPFLMVVRALPPLLSLSVLSYASSICGLFLGLYGLSNLAATQREMDGAEGSERPGLG